MIGSPALVVHMPIDLSLCEVKYTVRLKVSKQSCVYIQDQRG